MSIVAGARAEPWSPEELVERLRGLGARYHHLHPFHVRMDAGELSREELQRWVANRFYYQRCIPIKDAAILSNCPEVEVRRLWIQRIIDHDGTSAGAGGIEDPAEFCLRAMGRAGDLGLGPGAGQSGNVSAGSVMPDHGHLHGYRPLRADGVRGRSRPNDPWYLRHPCLLLALLQPVSTPALSIERLFELP